MPFLKTLDVLRGSEKFLIARVFEEKLCSVFSPIRTRTFSKFATCAEDWKASLNLVEKIKCRVPFYMNFFQLGFSTKTWFRLCSQLQTFTKAFLNLVFVLHLHH
jgi:hypothetical protein